MDLSEQLALAIKSLRAGEREAAGRQLGAILEADPDHADALHFSGVLAYQLGRRDEAVALIQRSLEINPAQASALNNLGNILRGANQTRAAVEAYFEALKIDPHHSDAWCNVGVLMRNTGNLEQAIEALSNAVEHNPNHAESWHNMGICLATIGRVEEAAEALRRCGECAGDSKWYPPGMHAYVLAALGQREAAKEILLRSLEKTPGHETTLHMLAALRGEQPAQASESYVRAHFDGFADGFDAILKNLNYRAPHLVNDEVRRIAVPQDRFAEVLDLGCGTGLCGALIRPLCERLTGIDLSPGMLRRAAQRGSYDALAEAELTAYLNSLSAGSCDLAVCVDTLCYIGVLGPVFAALRHALREGGHFVATVEVHEGDEPEYLLTISGRYSHSESYIRAAAEEARLTLIRIEPAVLRKEMGKPVNGLVFTLTR